MLHTRIVIAALVLLLDVLFLHPIAARTFKSEANIVDRDKAPGGCRLKPLWLFPSVMFSDNTSREHSSTKRSSALPDRTMSSEHQLGETWGGNSLLLASSASGPRR